MIPVLYSENAIVLQHDSATDTYSYSFPTNHGIGSLSDTISCKVTEERNGQYELELEYPVLGKRFSSIVVGALIKAPHDDTKDTEFFRIYKITKPMNGRVTVSARHFSYYLSSVTVLPFSGNDAALGPAAALRKMCARSLPRHGFTVSSDLSMSTRYEVKEPKTFRSIMGGSPESLIETFGGEVEWTGSSVKLWADRNHGIDSGVVLRYGKNLTDLKATQDSSGMWVGILPFWKGQYTSSTGRVTDLITYTDEPVYSEAADSYMFKTVIPVDLTSQFESGERVTKEALALKARAYIAANALEAIPTTIEVSFIPLWQTEEYKEVAALERLKLCDTLTIKHSYLGIDYTAKIIKVEYDVLKERYISMTIGQAKSNFMDSVKSVIAEATAEVPTMSAMQQAISHATELIQGGAGGHMVTGLDEDGKPHELYFMDTDDVNTAMKVLRINMNGIGFSSTGFNGPYHSAWTLDGRFVADYICVGSINASLIDVGELNASLMTTGVLKIIKKDEYGNPVLDEQGNEKCLLYADADKGELHIVADSFSLVSGDTMESIAQGAVNAYDETVRDYLQEFQDQLDSQVEWFFISGTPTTDTSDMNYNISPNKDWTTNAEKEAHLGDCCYSTNTGKAYKWAHTCYGTVITLSANSRTYNGGDYVKVYAQVNGEYRIFGAWGGRDLASKKAFVPAKDVYVYWNTSSMGNNAYGFKMTGKRDYVDLDSGIAATMVSYENLSDITLTNNKIPGWGAAVVSGTTLESAHNPYPNNLHDIYLWTVSSDAVTNAYGWVELEDESIIKALADAASAQDTADGKRRNFLSTPTPPYDVGDIWMDGKAIKTCITARKEGESYVASDWTAKNKYTDEDYVEAELAARDTKWSDEDYVFATLFKNGQRGFVYDETTQKMYISMDLMKGGTIKLGGGPNGTYGNGKFGVYDANGNLMIWMDSSGFDMYNASGVKVFGVHPNNSSVGTQLGIYDANGNCIIWFDKNGQVIKDASGNELMKINPSDGLMVGTVNGWGNEVVQIKDAEVRGYLGDSMKSGIDLVAQSTRPNGTTGYALALWNNNYRIVTNSDILDFESFTKYSVWNETEQKWESRTKIYMECSVGSGIVAYVATSGFSDRRAKENIHTASGFMEKIRQLRVVSFDWKDGHYPGHISAGLIAQEVQEILPELVLEDSNGMLGISFDGLVPFLVDAVQEKDCEIRQLQERVSDLEKRIEALEKLVQK